MKEFHLFYAPQLPDGPLELPQEEASHAVRVLRMKEGDELLLTNGCGTFFEARLTMATPKHCCFAIKRQWDDPKPWAGSITVAVAPTKNMDRMSGSWRRLRKSASTDSCCSSATTRNDAR